MKRLTEYEVIAGLTHAIPIYGLQSNAGVDRLISRLAAIEDILGDDYDLDRLRELVEADRDERCWTLPVKQASEVWFEDIDGSIISETVDYAGPVIHTWSAAFKMDDIGKTVFLTREAAEAALKGEGDANDGK